MRYRTASISLLITIAGFCAVAVAEVREPRLTKRNYEHWSFVAPKRGELPTVKDSAWPRNAIDHFILAKLESKNLSPMLAAGRGTLIRRVTFDLTGLPPTPAEVAAYLADDGADAYEKLVDRLLASPAYGERWAQHWLDAARFAETDGYEHDKLRPAAWKYRDWVIEALNADMPYDRFIRSQIAGDELGDGHDSIATGFLMAGPDFPDINLQEERRDAKLNEMTSTVSQVVLGLTLGCAQCHNHKYDALSQADFYRMRAIFAGTVHPKKDKVFDTVVREPGPRPPASFVMLRGDFRKPGPAIEPGYPRVLNRQGLTIAPPAEDAITSGRRATLAHWLTRADHPLTPRVAVNRIWLNHFGRGLVLTPGDFGFMGQSPTHPALLDWLAVEFAGGDRLQKADETQNDDDTQSPRTPVRGSAWSMKQLHRLIVTSATYMQSSGPTDREWDQPTRDLAAARWAANKRIDPDNANYWRGNRRRLECEAIRDAMLAVASRLNDKRGGPGVLPPLPAEVANTLLKDQWKVSPDPDDHRRRSIYLFARRNLRYPLFEVFDKPDTNVTCAQRARSITATQSLTMLNSQFSMETARSLAGLVLADAATPGDDAARIRLLYQHTLGRPPSEREVGLFTDFLTEQAAQLRRENRRPDSLAQPQPAVQGIDTFTAAAWVDLCLALLNVSEFVFVD